MFLLLSLKTPAGMSCLKNRRPVEDLISFFCSVFEKTNADKKRECFLLPLKKQRLVGNGNTFYAIFFTAID